jgi:hypothetical protein
MNWRALSYDKFTGVRTYWAWDAENRKNLIRHEFEDAQDSLDYAKMLRNDTDYSRSGIKGDNALHYAHIPCSVLTVWHTMGVNTSDKKAMFAMVNRPEWKYLKTTELFHS